MKNNVIIAVLLFVIGALVLNTLYGWFTPTKNDLIATKVENP